MRFDAPADATFTMPSGEVVSASHSSSGRSRARRPPTGPRLRRPLADFWEARIARQKAIDASIAAKAEFDISTTVPTSIRRPSASPARSPSRASARTAHSAWTRTTS